MVYIEYANSETDVCIKLKNVKIRLRSCRNADWVVFCFFEWKKSWG